MFRKRDFSAADCALRVVLCIMLVVKMEGVMRYARLAPYSIEEQSKRAIYLCNFFSPLENTKIRSSLGYREKSIIPLRLSDFFTYYKNNGIDLNRELYLINEILSKLCRANIMEKVGGGFMNGEYFSTIELSQRQKKGTLWLGRALGPAHIGSEIEKDMAYITGTTGEGDLAVGTGVLISDGVVLTCAHVVTDMNIDKIEIQGIEFSVAESLAHKIADVGLIFLEGGMPENKLKDLAFRSAIKLENVVIAGYPKVPRAISSCLVLQSGEICGHLSETMDKTPLDLFSAIARPGNSGGPVIGLDGRIVGIVTRSLERQREEADAMLPIPFFASVPSDVIGECVHELSDGKVQLPWEDYQ